MSERVDQSLDQSSGSTGAVEARAAGIPPDWAELGPQLHELVAVVARLRSPTGCPWDREQTLASIKPFTLEETYELLEAIDSGDSAAICEELGDVLLQVLLDSQIAADEQRFDLRDVVTGLTRKLIERHPHVFGDGTARTSAEVAIAWDRIKRREKARLSIFDGLPAAMPGLARAQRIAEKAARVGYDFPQRLMLFDKLREELAELAAELFADGRVPEVPATVEAATLADEAILDPAQRERAAGELGDVLFVLASIARRWGLNAEESLRASNAKFERRVRYIEAQAAAAGRELSQLSLREMEQLYQQGKRAEAKAPSAGTAPVTEPDEV